jgi:hypothetical protein
MIATTVPTGAGVGDSAATSGFRSLAAAPQPMIGRSMNTGAASHGSQRGIREAEAEWVRRAVRSREGMRRSRSSFPTTVWAGRRK